MPTLKVLDATGATQTINTIPNAGQVTMAGSQPVTIASDQSSIPVSGSFTLSGTSNVSVTNFPGTQPISATALPLPAGAATDANLTNVQSAPGSAAAKAITVQGSASGTPIPVSGSFTLSGTSSVTGTVTANAGTNLNTSALALESGGNLAGINTKITTTTNGIKVDGSAVIQPVAQSQTLFNFSTTNTSVVQLSAGASFVGTVESILNQNTISILCTCDTAYTITVNQYIDAAGVYLASSWSFVQAAGAPFSQAFVANGNYCNVIVKNNGTVSTTQFNLNTAYGTSNPVDQYGHLPTSNYDGLGNPLSSQLYPGISANGGTGYALQVDPTNAGTDGATYNTVNVPQVGAIAGKASDGTLRVATMDTLQNALHTEEVGPSVELLRQVLVELRVQSTLLFNALFPGKLQDSMDDPDVLRIDEDTNLTKQGY